MADASDFSKRAYAYFMDQGWAPAQAAALAGQGDWESGGRTSAVGDKGTAQGLFQWRGDRRQGLLDFAKARGLNANDEDTQLNYANWELTQGPEKASGDALRNAGNLTDATNAVIGYLRPQGWTANDPTAGHGYSGRFNNAAAILGVPGITDQRPGALPPTQVVDAGNASNPAMGWTPPTDQQPVAATPPAQTAQQPAGQQQQQNQLASMMSNGLAMAKAGQPQAARPMTVQASPIHRPTGQGNLLQQVFPNRQNIFDYLS